MEEQEDNIIELFSKKRSEAQLKRELCQTRSNLCTNLVEEIPHKNEL